MAVTHNHSMREYAEYLRLHPEEVGELVKSFLINVTQFFRDAEAFSYLRSDVLPRLIQRSRERDRVLRIRGGAVFAGDAPDRPSQRGFVRMERENLRNRSDEAAINFARWGLYSENLLKGVPNEYRDRFFERVDHGYRISKTLRQMVIFGQQDLSRSAPFPRIHLVLCRNVLFYFTPELQEYVLNQFAFSLSPGGYLFLGKAETVRPTQIHYELINKHWKVYRCIGNALPVVLRPTYPELSVPRLEERPRARPARSVGNSDADQEAPPPPLEMGQLRRLNELLLRFLPMGVVVIDRAYHVLTANGTARRLLGLREIGGADLDFLHAVRGIPYTTVRNAIDAVFRDHGSVSLPEIELDISVGGSGRFIGLSIALMQMESGLPDLAVLSVADVTDQVQVRRHLESEQAEQAQLMNELGAANKRLNDVNKELLDANEELVLTYEELQATIEEFETTNEELETTNEELRARTSELQELASMLESERVQLSEMVELAPFYILVLRGPLLVVEAFNPRYTRLLGDRVVQGRLLEEVSELFWSDGVALLRLAHDVYSRDVVRITPRMLLHLPEGGSEPTERYFVFTLVPSRYAVGRVTGVIIYAVDETEQRSRGVEEEREKLQVIFENANLAAMALYDAQTEELLMGSPHYLDLVARLHHLDKDRLIGCKWSELTFVNTAALTEDPLEAVRRTRAPFRLTEVSFRLSEDEPKTVWDWSLIPIMDSEQRENVRYLLVTAVEVIQQASTKQ